jgi:hypothetical protein
MVEMVMVNVMSSQYSLVCGLAETTVLFFAWLQ